MPNQRASGQVLIGCHVDAAFAAEIDRARGGRSRSDFLREALYDHLARRGYRLPESYKHAPDRAGKGGPSKKCESPPARDRGPTMLNEDVAPYRTRKKA